MEKDIEELITQPEKMPVVNEVVTFINVQARINRVKGNEEVDWKKIY